MLTTSQEKYLKQRLDQIINDKTSGLTSYMSLAERDAEFLAGNYLVERDLHGGYRIVFPKDQELSERYKQARSKLQSHKNKILDQVLLGSQVNVEELFQELKNMEV